MDEIVRETVRHGLLPPKRVDKWTEYVLWAKREALKEMVRRSNAGMPY